MRLHRLRAGTGRPLVSVVIPCYNYGHYLPDAVQSVLAQPGVDLEVIVVDDCSTDDSAAVAERLATQHPQVRLIRNPVNKRHIATYNTGLAEVTGDYVVLLSADDQLAPGALGRAAALFGAHPELSLVYGQVLTFAEPPLPEPQRARSWSTWRGPEWVERSCRTTGNLITNPEAIVRREVIERFGGYDPRFPHAADMLLWLQAATVGDVGRVNGTQAYYRDHGANMHSTDYAGVLTDMRERSVLLEHFLGREGAGSTLPGAAEMRAASRRTFAREALRYALNELDAPGPHDAGPHGAGQAEGLVAGLAEFAREQWPAVTGTRLGRAVESRSRAGAPAWHAPASRRLFEARWALRWQRRHRWGT
ncbi:glycosyltransferase family 2 protein [Nocardioides houyundeii]|uniref:glycosyltransferase family 2 protein n=1 Tax=Nocardioides houyundeii TaxID=2045452 RepID=UPI000C78346B|nr:glycosyltransferase [Nocardioides houyundeii]